MEQQLTIVLVCENTVTLKYRSGIQRVVIELARALSRRCELRLVKWDERDGQLRDINVFEMRKLFGDDIPAGVEVHPMSERVAFRFVDTISDPRNTWLLYTEVPHEIAKGPQKMAAMRAQCREVGVRSALIFYDLIPVLEKEYMGARPKHLEYMIEAVLFDRLFPISKFSGDDLFDFLAASVELNEAQRREMRERVVPAPLGEYREGEDWGIPGHIPTAETEHGEPRMLMLGTVEPRKQQVRLLKALNDARDRFPELASLRIDIFGSLYPDCAEPLQRELDRNKRIIYHRYASDEQIEAAFSVAWFSAFVSRHEGYGLPIVESLRHGVPCLTATFGAMGEIGSPGGCLLVDTLDDYEMVKGVRRMLNDAQLAAELKQGIVDRPKRSWGDYAQQIVDDLAGLARSRRACEADFRQAALKLAGSEHKESSTYRLHGVDWTLTGSPAAAADGVDRSSGTRAALLLLDEGMAADKVALAALADVVASKDERVRALFGESARSPAAEMLPAHAYFGDDALNHAADAAVAISRVRGTALEMKFETGLRRSLLEVFWKELPHPTKKLAVVISTYNRGPFVEHNVEWLLQQIDRDSLPVQCVVVDNASTDDTVARVGRFIGHPSFSLVENANNVGMLGNLRVCAAGLFAPYVWLIGDDDFAVPGRLQAVLEQIEKTPGLPLLVNNFAVYHRAAFSAGDHATHFLRERTHLAPNPSADGIRQINDIAGEHDNLYTAIYPLVFRSDVLAACFDYPFTGVPFGDLTECVPTTKLLLGTYRYADAYWFSEVGIVGNAHNSWSSHRPRWHLILMPLVFQLAREAGVNPARVWEWLQMHLPLFDDAVSICRTNGTAAHLDLPQDLAFAEWVFRQRIEIDPSLRLAQPSRIEHWRRPADELV